MRELRQGVPVDETRAALRATTGREKGAGGNEGEKDYLRCAQRSTQHRGTQYRMANAAFEIQSVMDGMAAMKEVVNTQDVERWTKTLGRALEFLNGGK